MDTIAKNSINVIWLISLPKIISIIELVSQVIQRKDQRTNNH